MTWPLFIGALLLGLIQGLTEFIPVSSSGHLILADRVLGYEREIGGHLRVVVFEVVIQLGSTAAILAVYGRELWGTAKRLFSAAPTEGAADGTRHLQLGWALVIGTLPVVVVGGLWGGAIQSHLYTPTVVAWSFMIGGVIIWLVESLPIRVTTTSTGTLTVRQALWVGLAQVLALVPGTSRSGASIMGGLGAGLDRRTATEFSFMLALPALIAASAYTVYKHRDTLDLSFAAPLAVGFFVSFLSSWLVIRWLLRFVRTHSFKGFAVYRIGFGLLLLGIMG